MSAAEAASPVDNLANLIVMLLAPMFLWSTCGDIRLAYTAAAQTVNEYRVTNRLSLLTVAKIIAFDIATLSSLSQSMHEDVSVLLALRLRGNANSLDRSGERNRRALEAARPAGAAEEPIEVSAARAEQMVRDAEARLHADAPVAPEPAADAASPAAVPAPDGATLATRNPVEQQQAAWADARAAVAEAFTTGLEDVPPEKQWGEMARIMALTTAAADLASPAAPPPVPARSAAIRS